MMKRVVVDKDKCFGCRICEVMCSAAHENKYNPKRAGIRVSITYPLPSSPVVCRQCPRPLCAEACPTGALEKGTWVTYEEKLCTGCGLCIEACPFQTIWLGGEGKVFKCDLCGGEPDCIPSCPSGALSLGG